MPAGSRILANDVQGTVTDNPLLVGATTMNSAGLANLPVVSSAHAVLVLDPLRVNGAPEIVVVTAHTASATSATITRGAYGTTARQHASGTVWVHAPTIDDVVRILTSATRPSDPYRGQLIFETDTNSFVARDTSDAWQTVVQLGAWTDYTPTLTQLSTVTKTVNYARYVRVGRMISVYLRLSVTGPGTASEPVRVGLPVASRETTQLVYGAGWIFDAAPGALYPGVVENDGSATTVALRDTNGTAASGFLGDVGGFTAALASGDVVTLQATYEAAS